MKRINDKKGMSLVFAIVMCMFLILITGTITTMAIMQQNETGGELNTRQAYVSAKAGLDSIHDQAALQKLMDNGEIAPPTVSGNSIYFILYYDANGELHAKQYATADLALNAIKNFESMFPNCTLAGDGTYFKMTMNPDGTYSVSALSEEGKYTGASGDVNFSDLSFTATITDEYVVTSKGATLPTEATTQAPTPPPANDNSTPFIMCGQQSAINLWSGEDGNGQSSKFAHSLHSYENVQGSFSFNLHVENGAAPFTSYFPVVFNYGPLYINSDASTRCAIDAKNNDIFIVGRMTDQQLLNIFFNTN